MAQVHDYTQANWGNDVTLDAPLQAIQGVITGHNPAGAKPVKSGDEIVLCLRCHVDNVEDTETVPESRRAYISFVAPVNADAASPQFLHQLVQQLGSSLQHSGLLPQMERTVDPVTQVAVRARFDTRIEQEWRRMAVHHTPVALILAEVDQLAAYRQTYDSQTCDDFLRQIAKAVSSSARRSGDLVARYQDSTLAILLPNTTLDAAICVAKKIRWRIKALRIMADQRSHRFTMSLGITSVIPSLELTPVNLIAGAEASLRQAQRAGGDQIIWEEGGL